jgi:hypothetical protein
MRLFATVVLASKLDDWMLDLYDNKKGEVKFIIPSRLYREGDYMNVITYKVIWGIPE